MMTRTLCISLVTLLSLAAAACAADSAGPEVATLEGELEAGGQSLTIRCTQGGVEARVVIHKRDGAYDVRATQGDAVLFDVTKQTPALNARLEDGTSAEVREFIDFKDAGLVAVPVDAPVSLELDLASARAITFRSGPDTTHIPCAFHAERLLRFLAFEVVSAEAFAAQLDGPKAVAFDIDDTLAFTTPAFNRAFAAGGAPVPSDVGFWTVVNGCDPGCAAGPFLMPDGTLKDLPAAAPSTAKQKARELVKLHKDRGDRVYAITARPDVNGDAVRAYVERELGIAAADVFFEPDVDQPGNPKGKTDRIEALRLDVFYGDSDSDITDAQAAFPGGEKVVVPVRFFRSPRSSNRKAGKLNKYHPGYFGEAIIAGSYE